MRLFTLVRVVLVGVLAVGCGARDSADQTRGQSDATAVKQGAPQLPAIVGPPDVALRRAALDGNVALVQAVLAKGTEVDAASVDGVTALMLAASKGHTEVTEMLLSKGARVDAATSREKVTALMMAANWAHTAVVDLLIERGASVNLEDSGELNVFDWAGMDKTVTKDDARALQRHLREKGVKVKPKDSLGLFLSVGSMPELTDLIKRATEENVGPRPERVGGDVKEPKKLKDASPVYPEAAKRARLQGIVILDATIGPDGKVTSVQVLRGDATLVEAAVAAVKQWEYQPPTVNGTPAPVVMTVMVKVRPR